MAGVSCRDYGGGIATKGWQKNEGPSYDILEDIDDEAAKQVLPEKSAAELEEDERIRWKSQQKKDVDEFAAARMEQASPSTSQRVPGLAAAAAASTSAAAKRRELPKMLQIKKKVGDATSAASPQPTHPAPEVDAKRQRIGGTAQEEAEAKKTSPPAVEAAKQGDESSGGGLLAGYGSSSDEEDDDDDNE
mmetsp:Transcript_89122/g.195250  ORF Transcript_89122/g.195250 Transcript_89122/m.195250 type:complete len:190 (-) Transcript_89122:172-741(-)